MTDAGMAPQPGYPGSGANPAGGYPPSGSGPRSGGLVATLALVLAGVILATVAVIWTALEGGNRSTDQQAGGEIFLESAASKGTSPFTEPVDPEPPQTTTSTAPSAATTPATKKSGTPPPSVARVNRPTSGVAPAPGSPPYGGSGDDTVCDREKLIGFLTSNPDRARAWAGVIGIDVASIPNYVRSLTPTTLLYDTRVTNHGFNGRATPLQSILQAGTAVLVDSKGNPVVRCRCGNPLKPPAKVAKPTIKGTEWPGYQPGIAVSVDNGATVTVTIDVQVSQPQTPSSVSTVPSTATSGPSTTGPGETSTTRTPNLDDIDKIEGLLAVLSECAREVRVLDVMAETDLANTYSVRAIVDGVEMVFVYNNSSGDVTEGDRASADLIARCGIVTGGG